LRINHWKGWLKPKSLAFDNNLMLQVLEPEKREVEEVPGAARGVKDSEVL
jgi:hypothetical protein